MPKKLLLSLGFAKFNMEPKILAPESREPAGRPQKEMCPCQICGVPIPYESNRNKFGSVLIGCCRSITVPSKMEAMFSSHIHCHQGRSFMARRSQGCGPKWRDFAIRGAFRVRRKLMFFPVWDVTWEWKRKRYKPTPRHLKGSWNVQFNLFMFVHSISSRLFEGWAGIVDPLRPGSFLLPRESMPHNPHNHPWPMRSYDG